MGNGCVKVVYVVDGFVKLFVDKEIDCILGVYLIGLVVGDLIYEVCVVMEFGVVVEDLVCICYVYLIFFEVVCEVVLVCGDGLIYS